MNRTAPDTPVTTTVSALSDRRLLQQLKRLTAVEHQLEIVVIDHLRELERRRLYLTLGCSSLFDYATRELGYSEAAAWRRIKAMRLCGEVEGARERMRNGSLTLNSAALLQNAFDRQERKQTGGGRGAQAGVRPAVAPSGSADGGALPSTSGAPAQTGERAEEPEAAPVLDSSARQALVEQAAGKSTRQVEKLLAGVDPELAAPADRIRPLGAGRWELKASIDDDCRRGLEQLKGLESHVDPRLTLGQLVGRVVQEAVERHDPARPPRGRRTGGRAATRDAAETSAPKDAPGPDATAAQRDPALAGSAHETSAPKDAPGPDAATAEPAQRKAAPAGGAPSPAKVKADCEHRRAVAAKHRATTARAATSAPKAEYARQAAPRRRGLALPRLRRSSGDAAAPSRSQSSGRCGSAIGAAAATSTGAAGAVAARGICCRSITSFRMRLAAAPSPTICGCCAPPITATATRTWAGAGRAARP